MSTGHASHTHDHKHGPHEHQAHGHAHVPIKAGAPPALAPSLLRLGLTQRLVLAGGLVLLVWAMILGVLS